MFRLLNFILSIVDPSIPKNKRIIVFSGNGLRGLNGNVLAVVNGWHSVERTKAFKSYVLSWKGENFPGFITISPNTLKGLWILLRSYTVIITHGPADLFWLSLCDPKRRRIINLWHGGGALKMTGTWNWKDSALIVTSESARKIIAKSTGENIKRVFVTGYPRTDAIVNDTPVLKKRALDILREKDRGQKWVLYAPTHRKGVGGKEEGYLHRLPDFSIGDLINILEKNNTNLIFRPHVNDQIIDFPKNRRIFYVPFEKLNEIEPLYALADILVTDYSSAAFDFVLLDRPILGLAGDFKDYSKYQGFLVDYRSSFPGPIAQSWKQLKNLLEAALCKPTDHADVRRRIRNKFNKFVDGKSTDRVIDLVCDLSIK
ncbi:MAG: CDP-glycerol glycerophosphotransferase family protein [Parcubacteria group bacterium]